MWYVLISFLPILLASTSAGLVMWRKRYDSLGSCILGLSVLYVLMQVRWLMHLSCLAELSDELQWHVLETFYFSTLIYVQHKIRGIKLP